MKEENKKELTVKRLREDAGLTQEDVARTLECSSKSVSLWDNAKQMPKIDNAVKLAKLYKVSLNTLVKAFGLDTSGIPNDEV